MSKEKWNGERIGDRNVNEREREMEGGKYGRMVGTLGRRVDKR